MAKPADKTRLLAEIQKERRDLEKLVASLSEEQLNRPGVVGEWSVKDVLAHLAEWEAMFLGWYAAGQRGETPHLPAEGLTWGQLPQLNEQIHARHRDRPAAEVKELFRASHREILEAVQAMPEEELFTPGQYAWTGKHALAIYVIPNTSNHYRWARMEIRKGLKKARGNEKGERGGGSS